MAIGKASDFKIYQDEFYGGQYEAVAQNLALFNGASAGAVTLSMREHRGDYSKESFLKEITNLISRRDTTSTDAVTDLSMTQDEFISVKLNRRVGPVAQTLDAWKKISSDEREMSFKLGRMTSERKMANMVNTAVLAAETAIAGQASLVHTIAASATVTHGEMVKGLAKMGDASQSIVAWVMHSKPFHDLMGQAIADKITNVADAAIYQGTVATLGRPVIVIDAPALYDANGSATDTYNTLGLVAGAVRVEESEGETYLFEPVTGLANLVYRFQGEFAYTVGVKGFKWDIASGAANPDDTAVGTTTNWDKVVTSDKHLAGVRIVSG